MQRAELDPAAAGGKGLITRTRRWRIWTGSGQPTQVLESFIDILRTAEEADVACLVKPVAEGQWSVSLRSRGGTDVSAVAVALGGGGHRLAAGFTGHGSVTDVIDRGPARTRFTRLTATYSDRDAGHRDQGRLRVASDPAGWRAG